MLDSRNVHYNPVYDKYCTVLRMWAPFVFFPRRLLSAADIHLLKSNTPKDKIKKVEYKY